MANGNGPSGDWIDRASRIVMQLGLPTVFAVVLLWFVLTRISASLDVVVREMQLQTQKLAEMQVHIIERDKQLFNYEWEKQQKRERQQGYSE